MHEHIKRQIKFSRYKKKCFLNILITNFCKIIFKCNMQNFKIPLILNCNNKHFDCLLFIQTRLKKNKFYAFAIRIR